MSKRKKIPRSKKLDRHHILWPQHDWNRGWAKALRNHWYMRIDIPMYSLHRKIHHDIMSIPVPRGGNAKAAFHQLQMLDRFGALHTYDNIEKRLTILMALFECSEPNTYEALKRQRAIVRKHFKVPQ